VSLSYQTEVLNDSPVLYLRCNETSGATVANTGSLGGNATATGSFTRNTTAGGTGLGVAVSFPGTTGTYIEYADNASLDITGDVTYEMWVQCDDFSGLHYLMSKGKEDPSNAGYSWYIFTDRTIQVWHSAIAVLFSSGSNLYPNDTSWHHIAFTRSSNTYVIYLDGSALATSGTVSTAIQATSQPFDVGRELSGGTPNGSHKGDVDEIAVYSTALSSTRIAAHYAARNTSVDSSSYVPGVILIS
jgi:hypothetical protein